MAKTEHNIRLTSSEIGTLWTTYMMETMSVCTLTYFLEKVEDVQIEENLKQALSMSKDHVQTIADIFHHENHPLPHGFTEDDVIPTAPRLFSDTYFLYYIHHMTKIALHNYGMILPNMARSDVANFISTCIADSTQLYNTVRKLLLNKGLYIRPPYISTPEDIDFVQKPGFLTGWLGDRRPLHAIEINHLFTNIQTNVIGRMTLIGFSQVCQSEDVREYFIRGRDISGKHAEVMSSILIEDKLPAPKLWDDSVMDSRSAPFSDKLMAVHTGILTYGGIGNYGDGMAGSTRRDIIAQYTRLMGEVMKYAEDGANLLIQHAWMEQVPQADDRDELARKKD
ncbi:DUF3231 family protein [Caldalkalibacillus salinus]|uniref:DUF3231 family protein n=1 Tax=Caldalkalibacillus salinus TaxID=2803787 RepID=UPI001922AD7B|nr:DUF3231 family protein [Caldalkalibacillus salinus]